MIEFRGELGFEAKKFVTKKYTKRFFISMSILTIIVSIPVIAFALTVEPLIFLMLLSLIPFWVCIFEPKSKSFQTHELPSLGIIDPEESTVVIQGSAGKRTERFSMIEDVERVDDYGEWYHMIIPRQDIYFIFQKDLITQGTIEEFERIFEDKIVRVEK